MERRLPWQSSMVREARTAPEFASFTMAAGPLLAALPRGDDRVVLVLPGLVAALPALEREVIILRFFKDLDQYEIAAQVGFSQMHISRLQRRALASMRAQLVQP